MSTPRYESEGKICPTIGRDIRSGVRDPTRAIVCGAIVAGLLLLLMVATLDTVRAQEEEEDEDEALAPLSSVPVPEPSNLDDFVRDRTAAERLGKALFWDMQVGSDAVQACASCHFHAGADNRRKNQLSPGLLAGDTTFQLGGPNYTLTGEDFPLTRHGNEDDPDSPIKSDVNDVVSSQGVFLTDFQSVEGGNPHDICNDVDDQVFQVDGTDTRVVEPRNAPGVVNAAFNHRQFWDGRANHEFNGVNPFGSRDPDAGVWKYDPSTGSVDEVSVRIENGSLASQAVGPPLSGFEMSCDGRAWPYIGDKLLDAGLVPLGLQEVHPDGSLLAPIARSERGLDVSYVDLVQRAFRSEWWDYDGTITIGDGEFTQMEANFSLFFGLAVQLYEMLLIADDTRVDRFLSGNADALSDFERQGLDVFNNDGRCVNCHGGAETTKASVRHVSNQRLERMIMGDGGCAIYDNGFYNIGVRPTGEDIGVGGTDPFGNPLSDTRMAMESKFVDPNLDPPLGDVPECDTRAAVDGAFKVPQLRNVELTGPHFHNGGKATLDQVVDFYNRGGDFASDNIDNLDPDIRQLDLGESEQSALVAFLEALTDERVRQESAPFDHPQLFRPQGHPGDDTSLEVDNSGSGTADNAEDDLFEVPAIGTGGRKDEGLVPLQPFMTVVEMEGGGRVGSKRDIANFGFKFEHEPEDDKTRVKVRLRDHRDKLKIKSDVVERFYATETCVQVWGTAETRSKGRRSDSDRYVVKICDNGQFTKKGGKQPGRRDWFEITVTGSDGFEYHREGRLTGGNVKTKAIG